MKEDFFEDDEYRVDLTPGAVLLGGFARKWDLLGVIDGIVARAPFRHMVTPGGHRMSVAMTCCGQVGWVTDLTGYRYQEIDPETGLRWPEMPSMLRELAKEAAAVAGFAGFEPDTCLINRYEVGAKLTLHQDKDELDYGSPIVSVSLGIPATFLFGGNEKNDPKRKISLMHGDVIVWGGPSRLFYHGILPLKPGSHHLLGQIRVNITFRKALH